MSGRAGAWAAGAIVTLYASGGLIFAAGSRTLVGRLGETGGRQAQTEDLGLSSSLFGLVRIGDRIPSYRLSGDATLPGLGSVAGVWRNLDADLPPDVAGKPAQVRLDGESLRIEPLKF